MPRKLLQAPRRGKSELGVAPRGHFVVYVGSAMERFVVPTSFLKNPVFVQLLDKAAEEYGFDNYTNITILPCDEDSFRKLIRSL